MLAPAYDENDAYRCKVRGFAMPSVGDVVIRTGRSPVVTWVTRVDGGSVWLAHVVSEFTVRGGKTVWQACDPIIKLGQYACQEWRDLTGAAL